MPELPEVETIARGLRRSLPGKRIIELTCYCGAVLAQEVETVRRRVTGTCFTGVRRHGKYLFLLLENALTLVVHLRMTGQLYMAPPEQRGDKHVHLEFFLSSSAFKLVYRDVRKFGGFSLLDGSRMQDFLSDKRLGPDALSIRGEELLTRCRPTRRLLKAVLLDQTVLAGLGNIYTDEVLHRAGLSPLLPARDLTAVEAERLAETVHQVLGSAIRLRGTTLSDYRDANRQSGNFQNFLRVYGRRGEACSTCGGPVHKIRAAGRGTYLCPRCQTNHNAAPDRAIESGGQSPPQGGVVDSQSV
jgi:formamidopyrimidine-DNA glycosylase